MGEIRSPEKVKLICGFIAKEERLVKKVFPLLIKKYGSIDFYSGVIPFNFTDYYQQEMGRDLIKQFVSFKRLISPKDLASAKVFSNNLEDKFSKNKKRQVNIDPGYISLAKIVLATTKNYSHRIYLDKGIYAEITLNFQDKAFKPNPWTYPDYKSSEYLKIFQHIRQLYLKQIHK